MTNLIDTLLDNFMKREDYDQYNHIGEVIDLTDEIVLLPGKEKNKGYVEYSISYINQNGDGFDRRYFSTKDYDLDTIKDLFRDYINKEVLHI